MRVLTIQSEVPVASHALAGLAGALIDANTSDYENGPAIAREQEFDVILIEIGPRTQAADVVQRLRLAKVRTPILLIAPTDRLVEVVRALSAGADDYLTLPLDGEALVKRVFQISREHSARVRPVLRVGKLKIDVERRTLHANGERIHITGKEFQMLELLATRQGTTVTKGMFLDRLYGGAYEPVMKIIDVFICKLRKKITTACGENYIETIWGRGYLMRDPQEETVDIKPAMAA